MEEDDYPTERKQKLWETRVLSQVSTPCMTGTQAQVAGLVSLMLDDDKQDLNTNDGSTSKELVPSKPADVQDRNFSAGGAALTGWKASNIEIFKNTGIDQDGKTNGNLS